MTASGVYQMLARDGRSVRSARADRLIAVLAVTVTADALVLWASR